jgi:hypothetical protein
MSASVPRKRDEEKPIGGVRTTLAEMRLTGHRPETGIAEPLADRERRIRETTLHKKSRLTLAGQTAGPLVAGQARHAYPANVANRSSHRAIGTTPIQPAKQTDRPTAGQRR